MMGETVEQCGRHLRIAEDAWPFTECKIGRDDDRGSLVEAADHVEQQLSSGLGEGQITELVEDDEVEARQIIGEPALAASSTFSLEPVDKIDRGEEATARSGADTTSCDRDRQMRLARARRDSAIMPGIRILRIGSSIPFIRAVARRSPSFARIAFEARTFSSCSSPTGP